MKPSTQVLIGLIAATSFAPALKAFDLGSCLIVSVSDSGSSALEQVSIPVSEELFTASKSSQSAEQATASDFLTEPETKPFAFDASTSEPSDEFQDTADSFQLTPESSSSPFSSDAFKSTAFSLD